MRLKLTLLAFALTMTLVAPAPAPMTADQARALLRQSFDLRGQGQIKQAIELAERVVAFDPWLEADFPDEKIHLVAIATLAWAYLRDGDWAKALPAWEQADAWARERYPEGDLATPSMIVECRRKLGEMGKLDRPPMVMANGPVPASATVSGSILVPVGKVFEWLRVEQDAGSGKLALVGPLWGGPAKTLVLEAGSKQAVGDGKPLSLPVAPRKQGADFLVPLRAVAEYFGVHVRWEPLPRIVWLD
jgi:tetratricopeptide (TPR) repeat protein